MVPERAVRFGLEEARIESVGGLKEASLVVGKYLSPRLYVTYGLGFFEPVSTFRIRYLLSRQWTIKAEQGEETSADFLYTVERGKGGKTPAPTKDKGKEDKAPPVAMGTDGEGKVRTSASFARTVYCLGMRRQLTTEESWNLQYRIRPYLENASIEEMEARLDDILRNVYCFTPECKVGVPPPDQGGALWAQKLSDFALECYRRNQTVEDFIHGWDGWDLPFRSETLKVIRANPSVIA